MTLLMPNLPGWYWVQDMHTAARPAYFNGKTYFPSALCKSEEVISFHWPSTRMLGPVTLPTEAEIKAAEPKVDRAMLDRLRAAEKLIEGLWADASNPNNTTLFQVWEKARGKI